MCNSMHIKSKQDLLAASRTGKRSYQSALRGIEVGR